MIRLLNIVCCLLLVNFSCTAQHAPQKEKSAYAVPVIGNSFEIGYTKGKNAVGKEYVTISKGDSKKVSTFFKLNSKGELKVKAIAKVLFSNVASLQIAVGNSTKRVKISGNEFQAVDLGKFSISKEGYKSVDFLSSTEDIAIKTIILEGSATTNGVIYCRDKDNFYWTRRGPSCHLGYGPQGENTTYYYNEVVVPEGQDVEGSYFMANGFGQGYFGIQVNSPTERRILFSVWSPFHTDDPNAIPEDQKIKLLKKGKDVYIGEFGNEGSGGQSFLRYNWKAGVTYKFLLKGQPDGKGNTDFTAWFFSPENNNWALIASFKRPQTNTYLKGFHSFLENFNPNQGYLTRHVQFKNQWTYNGQWNKVTQARLTVDATYRQGNRVDATGGTTANGYFLKMGGFFDEIEKPDTIFKFDNTQSAPQIDFDSLP
ncbi:DUF3472 domain-containing protein [Sphingobacterium sp. SGL-16]|uniref:DUF3472 domain-containing protein n=1 Tax=Sphingobacterium sp. SGL-16 TaxID=2710883 RepID=UPI0013EDAAD1|nr:DUF3472 domain-containing protein [Sphingobacterium sp. SGL-16]NGM73117.1 DUF3472 domain-containing protein [Sphingobacterium sp. SGL-16]